MFSIPDELKKVPDLPGVYIMRDGSDKVIYVGKSKTLKNRVRSYFLPSAQSAKHKALVPNIARFEYIVTDNETEAFLLECNLIKKYRPRYNVMLKDDKTYPYIKFTKQEEFPRVFMSRNPVNDGSKYYGPYPTGYAVAEVLTLIKRIWKLSSCERAVVNRRRACLNRDMGLCAAPCDGSVSKEEYARSALAAAEFLNGKHGEVLKNLEEEMKAASENMEFEKAAELRDMIFAVKKLEFKQKIDRADRGDERDAVGFAKSGGEVMAQVLFIREGKVLGRERHVLTNAENMSEDEIAYAFVTQFYDGSPDIPPEICLPWALPEEEAEGVTAALTKARGGKVSLIVPVRGEKARLVAMAARNAQIALERTGDVSERKVQKDKAALAEIAAALGAETSLGRIESYDISNTQGFESVGSMVVFEGGRPKRSDYRKFKIKTVVGADDFASMEEVLSRRFNRLVNADVSGKNASFAAKPDALFIDGGAGQVSAAEAALAKFGLNILVCGMIKDDRHRTRGLLHNGREVELKRSGEGFKLVTRIQDETHRFAVEYHRKLREKKMVKSELDDIKGVGKTRKKALMGRFGTVDAIRRATFDELREVEGMDSRAARAVWEFFNDSAPAVPSRT